MPTYLRTKDKINAKPPNGREHEIIQKFIKKHKQIYAQWMGQGGCEQLCIDVKESDADTFIRQHVLLAVQDQPQDHVQQQLQRITKDNKENLLIALHLVKMLQLIGIKKMTEMKKVMDLCKTSMKNNEKQ